MRDEITGEAAPQYLRALGKKHALTIVQAASEPVTIRELTTDYGVPRSTCYTRINQLTEAGVISEHGTHISPEGHHRTTFLRKVDRFDLEFSELLSIAITQDDSAKRALEEPEHSSAHP